MKKYIFAAVLSIGILASPAFTQASALTSSQINAIVSLLQSFGADQTTINNVQISLGGGTSTGGAPSQAWCHTFNADLTVGSSGAEVSALYRAIYLSGIAQTPETDTSIFGENMAGYVVQFQAKYGIRQTGYVGPITRAKLNALYGCPPNFPPPLPPLPPPSITVIYPTAGMTFTQGQPMTISWQSLGNPSASYTLGYSASLPEGKGVIGTQSAAQAHCDAADKCYISWTPTFSSPSVTLSIRDSVSGLSGAWGAIAIVAAPNKLQLTIPNNGEKWQIGSVHTIQWTPYNPQSGVNVVPTVSAYLERQVNGSFVTVGKIQEDGKASIHWSGLIGDTPQQRKNADPGEYYIRIVNSQTGEWDRSDVPFTLVAQNTIKVDLKINGLDASSDAPFALPTGGGEVTLSWTSLNADICRTYFYGLADDVTDLPSSGQKNVFLKQNPYTYVYGISLSCSASIGDARDIVYIAGANANSHVTITSPNGGESINSASQYPITWTSSNDITNVAIALYKNDAFYRWIAPNSIQSTGSLNWNPSTTLSGTWIEDGEKVFKIYMIGYKSSGGTVEDKSDAPFSIIADTTVSTPITLSSIIPSSGPVGTSIRLDGCGSDSTSGFTLVYSGPRSGTAAIPVETLGAASGCGYMTIAVPSDFPAGTYTLSVKNNQTGAMSTNSVAFTVTVTAVANNPVASVFPTSFVAGAPFISSVSGAAPNTQIRIFSTGPDGVTSEDTPGTTNSSGAFSRTYSTTGWAAGNYRGWVTVNGVQSNVATFTVTAPTTTGTTPITLTSITPSSGPVGTTITLSGCGSDSSSGFTLVYSGPRSGTAAIPVETLGAASGCGYMTIAVPSDFPAGTYTLSVKNNQTGAMSTNSVAFTVTVTAVANNPVASVFPTSFVAGAPFISSVSGAAPNTQIRIFSTGPDGVTSEDTPGTTNSSGAFSRTYSTTGWAAGNYRGWVTVNGVQSNVATFTVTAPTTGGTTGSPYSLTAPASGTNLPAGSALASALSAFSGATGAMGTTNTAPQNANNFTYVWNRDLQIGSPYPGDIAALQQALTREGVYGGEITGGFYNQTYTAVKAFQEKYGINQTGYVGSLTRTQLNTLFAR